MRPRARERARRRGRSSSARGWASGGEGIIGHPLELASGHSIETIVPAHRSRRRSACGLLGHRAGGGMAVLRAAQAERVRALVTWAAVARFGRLIAPLTDELRRTGTARVSSQRSGPELPLYRDMLDDLDAHGAG